MAEVESFTLDHTAVKAPYVRLINVEAGPKGDQISNFDVRLLQPNAGEIPTSGLHTIEHLLASLLRDRIDGVIDCSPFGCRTGFHLIGIFVLALRRIVLQEVSEHLGVREIVDGYDFIALCIKHLTKREAADTSETIDRYFYCHL